MQGTHVGRATVEVLTGGMLLVGSEEVVGTIPGCEVGDEIEVSYPFCLLVIPATKYHPEEKSLEFDGPMQARILRNGQPLRELDAAEVEAFGVIIGTMLDDDIILNASETWPEPPERDDGD